LRFVGDYLAFIGIFSCPTDMNGEDSGGKHAFDYSEKWFLGILSFLAMSILV
jgi:hypothetical protein